MAVWRGSCRSGSGTICVTYASTARAAPACADTSPAPAVLGDGDCSGGIPRSRAAAFTGSSLSPRSGGHATPASSWPAASRPRSTCSANAAWPTRRIRTDSGLQMLGEERGQTFPRVGRGIRTIGVSLAAEETVRRLRADVDLERLPEARGLRLERLHLIERDEGILLPEEGQYRRFQVSRTIDGYPAAVERDGCADLVGQRTGGQVADAAPHAEPRDAGPVGTDRPLLLERSDRGRDVLDDSLVGELSHQAQGLRQVVVGGYAPRTSTVEQIGRERHVPFPGEPAGHASDVVVQPERLLDHDHARQCVARRRPRELRRHRSAGRLNLDHIALDIHPRPSRRARSPN